MSRFIIEGNQILSGEIVVAGNKNAALPIIAATVLTDETCIIENLPNISDVQSMLAMLSDLGKSVKMLSTHKFQISGSISKSRLNDEFASTLRASILYLSVLLARTGEVEMVPPGGCVIGRRKVDQHFDALQALGVKVNIIDHGYRLCLKRPKANYVFMREASVTATENAMMLAAVIDGQTILDNAAGEPHVQDLAEVLLKMGANIQGAGTNRMTITGTSRLKGFQHRIMPDHIEAGTFAIAAACTGGEVVIHEAERQNLTIVNLILSQMGVKLSYGDEKTMVVKPTKNLVAIPKVQVGVWPVFPTDLMSPMVVLATQAKGTTLCHDWMYESRMFFVDKLVTMGAQIVQCDPHRVLVSGPTRLKGQPIVSPDIRAGIALVIAALIARGKSKIEKAELIDRGYEDIVPRFRKLGANISREQ
ncbi:MAG: UDP-N-acetylglucosamine 1-carboxyvinyltransferase [Candidatus Marinimicrobia bacterium]|nr:UDP-N-acetylglucosamine 1-carboxyvinyltransferase [Candidatus Neomarinimicrobiota bacterium]